MYLTRCVKKAQQLNLLALQRKVRHAVVSSLPADACSNGRFRTRKQIEIDIKGRMKKLKAARQVADRAERQHRTAFSKAVLAHCRDFYDFHLRRRTGAKKVGTAVVKELETFARKREEAAKKVERDRLQALRDNNEGEYIRLSERS